MDDYLCYAKYITISGYLYRYLIPGQATQMVCPNLVINGLCYLFLEILSPAAIGSLFPILNYNFCWVKCMVISICLANEVLDIYSTGPSLMGLYAKDNWDLGVFSLQYFESQFLPIWQISRNRML